MDVITLRGSKLRDYLRFLNVPITHRHRVNELETPYLCTLCHTKYNDVKVALNCCTPAWTWI